MIKKVFFWMAAWILILSITYLLGEAVVYGLFHKQIALFPRYVTGGRFGDFLIRRNIPNHRYKHRSDDGRWEFRMNAQGFRSDENYNYEKPQGMIRILVLGDSYTLGYEVSREENYASVLEQRLRDKGYSVQVINSGVSGYSNAEELVFLEQEGIRYRPDIVILGFYENDLMDNIRADLYRLKEGTLRVNKKEYLPAVRQRDFLHTLPLYSWLSEHSYLHNYLSQAATVYFKDKVESQNFDDVILQSGLEGTSQNQKSYENALAFALVEKIHQVSRENGAAFILMDIPKYDTFEVSFPDAAKAPQLCDVFLNTKEFLAPHQKEGLLYRPHAQRHWTEISHRAAGEKLAEIVIGLLKKRNAV